MIPDYVEIFDATGQQRDAAWLVEKYGPLVIQQAQGDEVFRLVRIDENTTGEMAVKCRVLYNDMPAQHNVAWSWPDAPQFNEGCATMGPSRAIFQMTDANGYTSFAMGAREAEEDEAGIMAYLPPDIGPYSMWVCSSLESDLVQGIGWLANTNHYHLDFVFARLEDEPGPEPEPEPEPDPCPDPMPDLGCWPTAAVGIAAIEALKEILLKCLDK